VEIVDGGSEGKLQTRKQIEIWFERKEEEEEELQEQELILVHVSRWVACSKCLGRICSGFGGGKRKWNRLMGVKEEEAGRGALAAAAGGGQQGSCYGGPCCMVIECEDDGCWQFLW
jgi:hypothetical protein